MYSMLHKCPQKVRMLLILILLILRGDTYSPEKKTKKNSCGSRTCVIRSSMTS